MTRTAENIAICELTGGELDLVAGGQGSLLTCGPAACTVHLHFIGIDVTITKDGKGTITPVQT